MLVTTLAWGPRMSRMACAGLTGGASPAAASTSSAVLYSRRTLAAAFFFFHNATGTSFFACRAVSWSGRLAGGFCYVHELCNVAG